MKKLYALCFITLAAVFIDIVFFHSSSVSAQAPKRYEIRTINPGSSRTIDSPGGVGGFSCIEAQGPTGSVASCYVLVAR
jgi:hypothetical protein